MRQARGRLVAALIAVLLAGTGILSSATAHAAKRAVPSSRLSVGVDVLRFAGKGRTVTARGLVTARLTDGGGHSTVVRQTISLSARTGGSCRVLHLFLDQLNLKLLGLTAHLDRVTLDITGNARGGVLGALFCRLARGASDGPGTARALNAALKRHPQHAVRFRAALTPARSAAATCQVLDLVVGPLNLQLLGLVVDLQKVHLNVLATRGEGKLGDLFCQLADQ
jgi:hypothetical protein